MANTPNLDLENVNVLLDTDYAYNQLVSEIIAKINNNNLKIDELPNNFILSTEKGVANGVASLGNDGVIPSAQLPLDSGSVERVADITARDAIINLYDNKLVFVIDASDDETVSAGWAMYIYSSSSLNWTKIVDGESLDINLTWDNIEDKPTIFPSAPHTHEQIETNRLNVEALIINKVDKIEGSRLVSETEIEVFNDKYTKLEVDNMIAEVDFPLATEEQDGLMSKEYAQQVEENKTDILSLETTVGDVAMTTSAQTVKGAINELDADIGNKSTLITTDKTNLVNAVNENREQINSLAPTRVVDGKFEYFDGMEWQKVRGDGYPVGVATDFSAKPDNAQAILTWADPADVTIEDSNGNIITIARWGGTKILRKTTGYPANENDGVIVVDSGIRNQYQTNGFIDTGLINGTTYYYSAFSYTTDNVFDTKVDVEVIPTEQKIYGIEIDEANSNPCTRVTYTDNAVGFTPCINSGSVFDWGSWENVVKSEFMIKPCVLSNPSKIVNYYLDYNDYTKKEDGVTASVLTGTDGDVMTEFGQEIYWKWATVGSVQKIQISIKPFEGAVKTAFEVEEGYNQFPYYVLLLTQILFPILFKSTDSQTALGRGYVDGNSGAISTGNTNTKGFMYGETTGKQQMSFLGIEDYWGNLLQWVDGLTSDSAFDLLIGNSGFNDAGTGYTKYDSGISTNTTGYIDKAQGGNEKGFIIKTKNGSETTHYADYGGLNSSEVAYFGGDYSAGSGSGFAYLRLNNSASDAYAIIGARLFCKANGKLYIGAYLGTTQTGKLRSVSGMTPTANKTIGVFRTEARANNI